MDPHPHKHLNRFIHADAFADRDVHGYPTTEIHVFFHGDDDGQLDAITKFDGHPNKDTIPNFDGYVVTDLDRTRHVYIHIHGHLDADIDRFAFRDSGGGL